MRGIEDDCKMQHSYMCRSIGLAQNHYQMENHRQPRRCFVVVLPPGLFHVLTRALGLKKNNKKKTERKTEKNQERTRKKIKTTGEKRKYINEKDRK